MDRKSWIEVLVRGTSYEIRDLIPGSDYGVSIQSVLGSDTSQAVDREFSTRKRHTHTETHSISESIGLSGEKKLLVIPQLEHYTLVTHKRPK